MRRDQKSGWWAFQGTGRRDSSMTRSKALTLLRAEEEGIAEWNRWFDRPALSKDLPDLSNADLRGLGLDGVRFRFARLEGADLTNSSIRYADLREADLRGAKLVNALLDETDFRSARLQGADLTRSWLTHANFCGNVHVDTDGYGRLNGVDLQGVKLRDVKLMAANLRSARLPDADLTGADLTGADLTDANITNAKLDDVTLGLTTLVDLNVEPLCAARGVIHRAPSIFDWLTIARSLHAPNLQDFLIRGGLPEVVALYMIDIARATAQSLQDLMRSAFISYGGPDEAFARRLYEALHQNGVHRLFLFSETAIPGDPIHSVTRAGITSHDRMILVCSSASLDRKGVRDELLKLLAREAREGVDNLLIPIDLDGHIRAWSPSEHPELGAAIRDRVIADFRGWQTDEEVFRKGISRLLVALRKKGTSSQ